MEAKITTVGEFIQLLKDSSLVERYLDNMDWFLRPEGEFERWFTEFKAKSVTKEVILELAAKLAKGISEVALHWSDPEPYHYTLKQGHELLREIYYLAAEIGIPININEVDIPLTPSEEMVKEGFLILDENGYVRPTKKAKQAAIRLQNEIKAKEN